MLYIVVVVKELESKLSCLVLIGFVDAVDDVARCWLQSFYALMVHHLVQVVVPLIVANQVRLLKVYEIVECISKLLDLFLACEVSDLHFTFLFVIVF